MNTNKSNDQGLFPGEVFFVNKSSLVDGPNSPGQQRQTALSRDGLWVGECKVTAMQQPSQWHHHKDYDSVMYMLAGKIRVDWGEQGEISFEMGPGDYAFFGRKVIHRAQILESKQDCQYVFVRLGTGESVEIANGPGFAN